VPGNDQIPASLSLVLPEMARSLSDAVHAALREAITDGTLVPGARLREVALAKQLSVSPTPVREALRRLEREGLVDTASHRGATVSEVTPALMANLYDLHETLEAFAVRRAAERGPHNFDHVQILLAEIDKSLAVPDQRVFNRLDLQLHRTLNELSGNPPVAELIELTHRRIQAARSRLDIHLPNRPRISQTQHREIVEAIAQSDADLAEQLARQHINAVREPVLTLMKGGEYS
jgi:DNA-binding GntR family transcriptional regulator